MARNIIILEPPIPTRLGGRCIPSSLQTRSGIVEFKTDSSDLDSILPNGGCTGPMKDLVSTTEEVQEVKIEEADGRRSFRL
jgi:hypothetical protein